MPIQKNFTTVGWATTTGSGATTSCASATVAAVRPTQGYWIDTGQLPTFLTVAVP